MGMSGTHGVGHMGVGHRGRDADAVSSLFPPPDL